MNIMTELT